VRAPGVEPDPYLVLGVARTATAAEIRAAYRALGAKYHPDRHQGNPLEELASAKMAEINRAYERLSDPARRAAFDRGAGGGGGFAGPGAAASGGAGGAAPGPSGRAGRRLLQIVALASLLPLVLRFGGLIVRALAAVGRELVEAVAVLRGTPAAAGAVVLAAAILVAALIRRRRRAKRDQPPAASPPARRGLNAGRARLRAMIVPALRGCIADPGRRRRYRSGPSNR